MQPGAKNRIFCAQGIAGRRRQPGFGIALGNVGADRGGFGQRRLAVLQRRHLAHRIDGEVFRRPLCAC
jgi:hypothetical protein